MYDGPVDAFRGRAGHGTDGQDRKERDRELHGVGCEGRDLRAYVAVFYERKIACLSKRVAAGIPVNSASNPHTPTTLHHPT